MEGGWEKDKGCMERAQRREKEKAKTPRAKVREVKEKEERASTVDNQDIWRGTAQIPVRIRERAPTADIGDTRPSSVSTPEGCKTWMRTGM